MDFHSWKIYWPNNHFHADEWACWIPMPLGEYISLTCDCQTLMQKKQKTLNCSQKPQTQKKRTPNTGMNEPLGQIFGEMFWRSNDLRLPCSKLYPKGTQTDFLIRWERFWRWKMERCLQLNAMRKVSWPRFGQITLAAVFSRVLKSYRQIHWHSQQMPPHFIETMSINYKCRQIHFV